MAGLRERKKQATRLAIHEAGMRLFAEHGFAATTIDQIAEAANVSRATVFSYYATKEDIVFGDAPAALDALRAALAPGVPTTAALRDWLLALVELGGWIEPELVLQLQLAAEAPPVGARRLALHRALEEIVAEALIAELGPGRRVPATLAAAALIASMLLIEETAAERMRASGQPLERDEIDALLNDAVRFAEAGMAALEQ